MSNIYIQEPPTLGKVLLHTTVGDIDIELWARETPRACRNFVQLCLEGYYNDTIFHRLVKGFIVQGGDPTGTGEGGESAYGTPFKDEFHSRLRFCRRGLLAMANAGKDDNGSQFFFTLGPAPELQNKHTIFGKVAGETIYNMLKLAEGLVDRDERPQYPNKIISTEVLSNPFPDIVPRVDLKAAAAEERARKGKRDKRVAVKDFKLLSFGSEAEDDEAECEEASRRLAAVRPSKSAHDLVSDPSLSSAPAVPDDNEALSGDEDEFIGPAPPIDTSSIRNKLQKKEKTERDSDFKRKSSPINDLPSKSSKSDDYRKPINSKMSRKHKQPEVNDTTRSKIQKVEEEEEKELNDSPKRETSEETLKRLRDEYKQLRNQLRKERHKGNESSSVSEDQLAPKKESSELLGEFEAERDKYRNLKNQIPKKGASREDFTLQLLKKFQQKLALAKDSSHEIDEGTDVVDPDTNKSKEEGEDDEDDDSGWMTHKLQFNKADAVLAKDANTKEDDWFDIYDPRNPVTKRRREAGQDKKISQDLSRSRDKPYDRSHNRPRDRQLR